VAIAMPTFSDEASLFGDASPAHTVERWRDWGAVQVIVKLGAAGCLVASASGTQWVPAVAVATVIDTTGAGDAFNAGFLAARSAAAGGAGDPASGRDPAAGADRTDQGGAENLKTCATGRSGYNHSICINTQVPPCPT